MISKVTATGFKGLSFETPLSQHVLLLGPNGAGKSARTQAIQLAVKGYVPGGPKTNVDILDTYGNGQEMIVGIQLDTYLFERRFFKGKNGNVSQDYRVNGKKAAKEFFISSMAEVGRPKVHDISAFMAMSDQKKIDTLFGLFPPGGDIQQIDIEIDKKKESLTVLKSKINTSSEAANRLTEARATLELPASTLAEVQEEIKKSNGEIEVAQAELQAERVRIASAMATKTAEDDAARKVEETINKADSGQEAHQKAEKATLLEKVKNLEEKLEQTKTNLTPPDMLVSIPKVPTPGAVVEAEIADTKDVLSSFDMILAIIEKAGCSGCAARLVVKREMQKYRGGE